MRACVRACVRACISCPPCSPFMSPNTRGLWQWPRVVHYVRTGSCRGCEETPWWYQNIYHRRTNTYTKMYPQTPYSAVNYTQRTWVSFSLYTLIYFFFLQNDCRFFHSIIPAVFKTKMKKKKNVLNRTCGQFNRSNLSIISDLILDSIKRNVALYPGSYSILVYSLVISLLHWIEIQNGTEMWQ